MLPHTSLNGLQYVLVVLVEEGLGDVVKQLRGVVEQSRDVLELLLFYMKAHCPLGFLEQSFSQLKPQNVTSTYTIHATMNGT
jgi:hypothetical protein